MLILRGRSVPCFSATSPGDLDGGDCRTDFKSMCRPARCWRTSMAKLPALALQFAAGVTNILSTAKTGLPPGPCLSCTCSKSPRSHSRTIAHSDLRNTIRREASTWMGIGGQLQPRCRSAGRPGARVDAVAISSRTALPSNPAGRTKTC
jgi:hypothetical protein